MNNQEATLLLHAYRPNGQDADDPRFSEALEQTRRDPALGRWFADQQAFDQAVSERLRGLPAPAGLKICRSATSRQPRRSHRISR